MKPQVIQRNCKTVSTFYSVVHLLMLQLCQTQGEIPWQESKQRAILGRFVNYIEQPNSQPTQITVIQFNSWFNSVAIGDKHGRVLIVYFFASAVYHRLDVVHDVSFLSGSFRESLPRNTAINCLCYSETFPGSSRPNENSSNDIQQYLFVSLRNQIVGYPLNDATPQRARIILPKKHRRTITSLHWLPSIQSHNTERLYGLLLSGSSDSVIIWNTTQWTPVKILSSSKSFHLVKVCPVWLPSASSIGLQTTCIATLLLTNTIKIWDIHHNTLVDKLESSTWMEQQHVPPSTVHFTLLLSNYRQNFSSSSNQHNQRLSTKCFLIAAGRSAEKKGVVLLWQYSDVTSRLIKLDRYPLEIQCLEWDSKDSSSFASNEYFRHFGILMDSGAIEIRDLLSARAVLFRLEPSSIEQCHSRFLTQERLRKASALFKRGEESRFEINVNSKLRGIVTFALDIEKRRLSTYESICIHNGILTRIVVAVSDGSVQILSLDHLKNLQGRPIKTNILVPRRNEQKGERFLKIRQRIAPKKVTKWKPMAQQPSSSNLSVVSSLSTSSYQSLSRFNEDIQTEHLTDIQVHSQTTMNGSDSLLDEVIVSPLSSISPDVSPQHPVLSYYENTIPNLRVPNSLMYLYTHPNSDYGWINPKSQIELPRPVLQSLSLFELRQKYLLNYPFHYPHTYRQEIWELILNLPKSQHAFDAIRDYNDENDNPDAMDYNLEIRLPLNDPFILRRMKTLLLNIVKWCEELKGVQWIEQLCYAFVKMFPQKPVLCFEILLSIILWWSFLGCRQFDLQQQSSTQIFHLGLRQWGWLCGNEPKLSPMGLICFTSYILMNEEPELWLHIVLNWNILSLQEITVMMEQKQRIGNVRLLNNEYQWSGNTGNYPDHEEIEIIDPIELHSRLGHRILWPLIRSLMSEVLNQLQIQILWDHLFTSPMRPLLINAAVIAFLSLYITTLKGFHDLQEYLTWSFQPHPFHLQHFIEKMYRIDCKISNEYLPKIELKNEYMGPIDISMIQPPITLKDLNWPSLKESSLTRSCETYPQITFQLQSLRNRALDVEWTIRKRHETLLESVQGKRNTEEIHPDETSIFQELRELESLLEREQQLNRLIQIEKRKEIEKPKKFQTEEQVEERKIKITRQSFVELIPQIRPRVIEEELGLLTQPVTSSSTGESLLSESQHRQLVRGFIRGRQEFDRLMHNRLKRRKRIIKKR